MVQGDLWRINLPDESNNPAALFISGDGSQAVLFYFQISAVVNHAFPFVRLQGLDAASRYMVDGNLTYSGSTLMNVGLQYAFDGDFDSRIMIFEKI